MLEKTVNPGVLQEAKDKRKNRREERADACNSFTKLFARW